MDTVRIGCVQYLNTLPLIEGLKSWSDAELVTAIPSRLFAMLASSEVDVALASVIDAAKAPEAQRVTLLPVGMIGCDGPTLTVRLFSRTPIETLERVAADTDSHTSVVLLQVLMHKLHNRRVSVVDFDARERMILGDPALGTPPIRGSASVSSSSPSSPHFPDAVLLIGDKVVTDAPPAEDYPHQMDLGAAWKSLTGLPFVYAAWMCRAGEDESLNVRTAAMMLDRARRHNATRLDWIVASRAADKHWPADLARQYLGEYLHYAVGPAEREAAAKFVRFAAELGLCRPVELQWADEASANNPA